MKEQKEEKLEIKKTEYLYCSVSVAGSDLGYSHIGIYTYTHTYIRHIAYVLCSVRYLYVNLCIKRKPV
jgi:hypothetical protein